MVRVFIPISLYCSYIETLVVDVKKIPTFSVLKVTALPTKKLLKNYNPKPVAR
jgi:hypothetical protein